MKDFGFVEVPESALKITDKCGLSFLARGAGLCCATANAKFSSGVHYFEVSVDQAQHGGNNVWIGITEAVQGAEQQGLVGWGIQNFRVVKDMNNNVTRTYGYHFGSGSKIGVLVDVNRERIEFFFEGESLGNAFVHSLELGNRTLCPVVGIKGDATRVTLLPHQTFSTCGLSSQRALHNLTQTMDILRYLDEGKDLPKEFISETFNYWKRWANGREYWITLKNGIEVVVDISDEGCKGISNQIA